MELMQPNQAHVCAGCGAQGSVHGILSARQSQDCTQCFQDKNPSSAHLSHSYDPGVPRALSAKGAG